MFYIERILFCSLNWPSAHFLTSYGLRIHAVTAMSALGLLLIQQRRMTWNVYQATQALTRNQHYQEIFMVNLHKPLGL